MFNAQNTYPSYLSYFWFLRTLIFSVFLLSNVLIAHAETVTYDANGNVLSDGQGSNTYSSGSNRLTSHGSSSVTTDAAGNITSDGAGTTFTYNSAGRLIQVFKNGNLVATFTYNTLGQRTSKITPASTTAYHYDIEGHLLEETSGAGALIADYVWVEDTPIAVVFAPNTESNPGSQNRTVYIHVDHLNTPRSATDSAGKIVWRWDSNASGRTAPNQDPGNTGIQTVINLRFPGQYYDKETALNYNWNRYYDPATRRYTQPDPIGPTRDYSNPILQVTMQTGVPLLRNRTRVISGGYTYALDNPVSITDPAGLSPYPRSVINPIDGGGFGEGANVAGAAGAAWAMSHSDNSSSSKTDCKDECACKSDDHCEKQAQEDETMCRMSTIPGTGPRSRCWASVQDRYGACVAGKPLPPLIMW